MLRLLPTSFALLFGVATAAKNVTHGLVPATPVAAEPEAAPTSNGVQLDPVHKGFKDSSLIPRLSMVVTCRTCHACADPLTPMLHHIDSLSDCEQSCFFDSRCRHMAFETTTKTCLMFGQCQEDTTSSTDWTRAHKRDPGVFESIELSSGCSLSPSFAPMAVNYLADCPGQASAAAKLKSKNDVLVNGIALHRSEDGDFWVPAELYHNTPTVLTVHTLEDVEAVDQIKTCTAHHHCTEGYWVDHVVCAGGFCREKAMTYRISFLDSSAAHQSRQPASTDPYDGAASRETVLLAPPQSEDVISVYAQVTQNNQGPDYERDVMNKVMNTAAVDLSCEHCTSVCSRGEGDKWLLRESSGRVCQEPFVCMMGSVVSPGEVSQCQTECYYERDCVGAVVNENLGRCDLFKQCDKKDMISPKEYLKQIGEEAVGDKEISKSGEVIVASPHAGQAVEKIAENQAAAPTIVHQQGRLLAEKKVLKQNKETFTNQHGEKETLSVPEEFKLKYDTPEANFMLFKRPEMVDEPVFHRSDKHLLNFGGTKWGTIDLVGQGGVQDCHLNAHAGSGTGSDRTHFVRLTCPKRMHDVSIYFIGRGISTQNFHCDTGHLDSDVSVMVHDMNSVDQLGAARDSVELATEFSGEGRSIVYKCISHGLGHSAGAVSAADAADELSASDAYAVSVEFEFVDHDSLWPVLSEEFAMANNYENGQISRGFVPRCRDASIRNAVVSNTGKCDQVPKVWKPSEHRYLRFICPAGEAGSVDVSPVLTDPSAKFQVNGEIMRNMHETVGYDESVGGSPFGGVDFYYPINGLSIGSDQKGGVKSWSVDTFCEENSKSYDVILQNGWNLEPDLLNLEVTTGEQCILKPAYSDDVDEYHVTCPGTTKYVGITPEFLDVGTLMRVNGESLPANLEINPVHLSAGEEHTWDIEILPPIDPETKQVVFGYKPNSGRNIKVTAVRFAPWGLGDAATKAIAGICSGVGLGLAIVSSANFVGVAKFLQFLGILVAVHGCPDAFHTFCNSFSNVNLQFNNLDDYVPNMKKMLPFDLAAIQKSAANAAGLPFRALKVLQEHAAMSTIKLMHGGAGGDDLKGLSKKEKEKKLKDMEVAAKIRV